MIQLVLKEALELSYQTLKKARGMSLKKLVKVAVKYTLLFFLAMFYIVFLVVTKGIEKLYYLGVSVSYGILKPCKRCVFAKSRETVAIVSLRGYSRDDEVLMVMNYKGYNWYRRGSCIGYRRCGRCLEAIDKTYKGKCTWVRMK